MPEQSLFNTNVFSIKSITVALYFGTLDSVSSVGGHFKQQSYKRAQKLKIKIKKIGRILEYSMRGENRKQSSSFFNLSWKEACWATLISFSTALHLQTIGEKASSIVLGVANK